MATLNLTTITTLLSNSFAPKPNIPFLSFPSNTSLSFIQCTQHQPIKCRRTHALRAFDGKRSGSGNSDERETIMLPGCDYNHWLIVMEFPKDPAPTREQMIDTYLDTLAQVVGSMEEAKNNMYAFSTTTYTGFQCTVSEETSEKLKGLPGVLWVLPDSYIDVKNKDYGGDKYVNGEIIPCQYPTYQPKQSKSGPKYKSKAYVRQRDGPPAEKVKPKQVSPSATKQETPSDSESSSS